MKKISKRMKDLKKISYIKKIYTFEDAINILKDSSKIKFNESIDIAIKLGIDNKQSNQIIKGISQLKHGTGKNIKIAVFAEKDEALIAKQSGADIIGMEDLANKIKNKKIKFNILISSKNNFHMTKGLNRILGSKGMMPNIKNNTLTDDIKDAIYKIKNKQINYRNDKNGIIHSSIGRLNFTNEEIKTNLLILMKDLIKLKPSTSKGKYIKKISLSSTMSTSFTLDINNLEL